MAKQIDQLEMYERKMEERKGESKGQVLAGVVVSAGITAVWAVTSCRL